MDELGCTGKLITNCDSTAAQQGLKEVLVRGLCARVPPSAAAGRKTKGLGLGRNVG